MRMAYCPPLAVSPASWSLHVDLSVKMLGLDQLRSEGHPVLDEAVAHLSPTLLEHANPYGTYNFDVDHELARPGLRPLRSPSAQTP
jgi:hypothetical protein